jgi:rare lipoprotein A
MSSETNRHRLRHIPTIVCIALLATALLAAFPVHAVAASAIASTYGGPGDGSSLTIAAPSAGRLERIRTGRRLTWHQRTEGRRPIIAHKSLPFGTIVRITYRRNTVDTICLDRGPYVSGRTFDLGPVAAYRLGFRCGVGRVSYKVIGRVPKKEWRHWGR